MPIIRPRPLPVHDVASNIALVDGEVVILGPGALSCAMTPEAARETVRRLTQILARLPAK